MISEKRRKLSKESNIKRTAGLLWGRNVGIRVFSGSAATQVASSHKLLVVHSPPRPKVILIANKAFMERQIGAYCILCREGGEENRRGGQESIGDTEGWGLRSSAKFKEHWTEADKWGETFQHKKNKKWET